MEHPLVGKLDQLTEDQLSERIDDLSRKLAIAKRMNSGLLAEQLLMALDSYQTRLRYVQQQKNQTGNSNPHFDKIDIS